MTDAAEIKRYDFGPQLSNGYWLNRLAPNHQGDYVLFADHAARRAADIEEFRSVLDQRDKLALKVIELNNALVDRDAEVARLNGELNTLRPENAHLTVDRNRREAEITRLNAQLYQQAETIKSLRSASESLAEKAKAYDLIANAPYGDYGAVVRIIGETDAAIASAIGKAEK